MSRSLRLGGSALAMAMAAMMLPGSQASAAVLGLGIPPGALSTRMPVDHTSALEARRVSQVATPVLNWQPCYETAECATATLPLDYDQPRGPQIAVALLRVKARDQAHKIGSLFINPGGPGGSGVQVALALGSVANARILDRFDLIGMDPRGTNGSTQVRCFATAEQESAALTGLSANPFPLTESENIAAVRSSKAMGRGCSTTGRPLAASMSTAEVARDMDVIRRAVGDDRLTYLGFSYGSYLGQVYANMFPDRVRALVIDGVVDPVAWAGTPATAGQPFSDRLRSADGAAKALREILIRCGAAGIAVCPFASADPVAGYASIADQLKTTPLVVVSPATGETITVTYAVLVAATLQMLYSPDGYLYITAMLADIKALTDPGKPANPSDLKNAAADLGRTLPAKAAAVPDTYVNSFDATMSVACTDTLNPGDAAAWPGFGAAADRRAPYFGRLWSWWSSSCAHRTWTATDEDAYRGSFTHRTSATVLVVGNYWDPATNYNGAVAAARLLPNSRLLSSDSWGHTAYFSSACATDAVDTYLLTGQVPAAGTVCHGDVQPFAPVGVSAATGLNKRARLPIPVMVPQS